MILVNYLETREFTASVVPIRKRYVFRTGSAAFPFEPSVPSLGARRVQATQDRVLCCAGGGRPAAEPAAAPTLGALAGNRRSFTFS
jgi:hypothetical protein